MKSNNVYEYQKAIKQRVRMYTEFKEKFGRDPVDGEICGIPTPPADLVQALATGTMRYRTPEATALLHEQYRIHAAKAQNILRKRRLAEFSAKIRPITEGDANAS